MYSIPDDLRKQLQAMVRGRAPVPLSDQIFANALNFHESAQRCFENREEGDGRSAFPIMPGIVGLAFACELYLKALFVMETGKPRAMGTHRLNVLFVGLSGETKSAVTERYNHRRRGLKVDLQADLLTFANAFVDFRYVYEGKAGDIDIVGLGQLAASLYEATILKRPDLQAAPYTHGRLTAAAQGLPMFGGVAPRQAGGPPANPTGPEAPLARAPDAGSGPLSE